MESCINFVCNKIVRTQQPGQQHLSRWWVLPVTRAIRSFTHSRRSPCNMVLLHFNYAGGTRTRRCCTLYLIRTLDRVAMPTTRTFIACMRRIGCVIKACSWFSWDLLAAVRLFWCACVCKCEASVWRLGYLCDPAAVRWLLVGWWNLCVLGLHFRSA